MDLNEVVNKYGKLVFKNWGPYWINRALKTQDPVSYGHVLGAMRKRGIIRTKNVVVMRKDKKKKTSL